MIDDDFAMKRLRWVHSQIRYHLGIHYSLIINSSTRDRSIMIGEENLGAWCWDHTYKTYDRRVWSSCVRVAWFWWLAFSSRFSPKIPIVRQHHQPSYRWCFRLWVPGPMELCVLKHNNIFCCFMNARQKVFSVKVLFSG